MDERPPEVLVVEDNLGDARLVAEAFKEIQGAYRLVHVSNGEEALRYLKTRAPFKETPRPALILLDWNLPRLNGREVLVEIKTNPLLKSIPVIVFSSSQAPEDIQQVYNLYANCYVTKPDDVERYIEVLKVIQEFWLRVVQLPPA